jgi:hypothetical protein
MNAFEATVAAQPYEIGWWADPKWWIIIAIVLVVVILVGIYMKALSENQGFGLRR